MASSTALYRNKPVLQARLKELPASPGIYRFYDANGALVYVGKSICLRDRVRSYFTGQAAGKKQRRMRQEISTLDWEVTGSELEALLLESRLVKRHQPRFNVMLREFVPLPYVRVDMADPYPRLELTRCPARDGAAYFGPFRSYNALEAGVAALTQTLQLRDCDVPGERLLKHRPCYRHELGTCSAPCLGLISEADYRKAVENACSVLDGREQTLLQALHARMERAAERLQFEIAARLRDAIRLIRAVGGRQHALISAIQDLSLVAVCPSRNQTCLCLFVFRSGHLVLHAEAPIAELQLGRSRRAWARRLAEAWERERELSVASLNSALLDEIQIVSTWMRQKTREGAYWQFPATGEIEPLLSPLDAWLAEQAGPMSEELAA
jgi:excinuclease UvrABC nuclease subunit